MPTKTAKRAPRSTNYVTKTKKKHAKTTIAASASFKKAYNAMLPSKMIGYQVEKELLVDDGTPILDSLMCQELYTAAAGPQQNQRGNNLIYASYVQLKFSLANNSNTKFRGMRVMIIQPKNARKGDLNCVTFPDVLFATSISHTGQTNAPLPLTSSTSGYNYQINTEKFRIYYDKRIPAPREAEGNLQKRLDIRIGSILEFDKNDVADSTANNPLYLIMLACNIDSAEAAPTLILDAQIRCYFKDYNKRYLN